jgi:hypothetical protein
MRGSGEDLQLDVPFDGSESGRTNGIDVDCRLAQDWRSRKVSLTSEAEADTDQ